MSSVFGLVVASIFLGERISEYQIIANSTSYGIYIETNPNPERQKTILKIYGLDYFEMESDKTEDAGRFFHPIMSVFLTACARLILGTAQTLVEQNGGYMAYCDTDSVFISPQHVTLIQNFFKSLNPYDMDVEMFKVEEDANAKELRNVWFYGISAKRYVLYDYDDIITIRKHSAHGLGHLIDVDEKQWWHDILSIHYGLKWNDNKYSNQYAVSQLTISNFDIYKRFAKLNDKKTLNKMIKPFNTAILGFSNGINPDTGMQIRPIAPYLEPVRHAVFEKCIDYNSGKKICGKQYWKTLTDGILEYVRNPESKLDGNEGVLCRKNITVSQITHIGKESNNLDKVQTFGTDLNSYVVYEDHDSLERKFRELIPLILKLEPKDVKSFGISRQTLWNVKNYLQEGCLSKISLMVKMNFLNYFV